MLIAIEQCELIDEDDSHSKALGVTQSIRRDRDIDAEDALHELFKTETKHTPFVWVGYMYLCKVQ